MGDAELVLRFFAYRQRKALQKSSLESYLDYYLERGNYFSDELLSRLEMLYLDTIKLTYDIFGEKAFYLYRNRKTGWSWYERPTTAVFDPMMMSLSERLASKDILISKKNSINSGLVEFYTKNYDKFEGRNTNPAALEERDARFNEFFDGFI